MKALLYTGIAFGLMGLLLAPSVMVAQSPPGPSLGGITQTPVLGGGTPISNIIIRIINWAFGLLLLLAVIFIIWAAFLYLTSGGDEDKIKNARRWIIYAIVAIIVAAIARIIVAVTRGLLGV